MNSGRFCESEFWTAKVAMNRMSKGNTFYGRKAHITSYVDPLIGISSDSFLHSWKPMKLILCRDPFAITEIDFVPGPFCCQIELGHLTSP